MKIEILFTVGDQQFIVTLAQLRELREQLDIFFATHPEDQQEFDGSQLPSF